MYHLVSDPKSFYPSGTSREMEYEEEENEFSEIDWGEKSNNSWEEGDDHGNVSLSGETDFEINCGDELERDENYEEEEAEDIEEDIIGYEEDPCNDETQRKKLIMKSVMKVSYKVRKKNMNHQNMNEMAQATNVGIKKTMKATHGVKKLIHKSV